MNIYRSFKSAACLAALSGLVSVAPSCTDDIKFGDSFQEKAPGGTISIDSVFINETYTRGFLANVYAHQYYGLPYGTTNGIWSASSYHGKLDAVTDIYQLHWSSTTVYSVYYQDQMSSTNGGVISYTDDAVWETVRLGYQFIENVDKCTALDESLRERFKAEAKCVIASRYFDLFTMFGGLPLIDHATSLSDNNAKFPRATVEETVNYMVGLLDEAIAVLPWAYNGNTSDTNSTLNRKRWSRAGAMALKAKILTFAASPLFNSDEPYLNGEAAQQKLVWYGDYSDARWQTALNACQDFFDGLNANGYYALEQAASASPHQYRLAYRKGYLYQTSTEPLHVTSVRDYDNAANGYYSWSNWVNLGRNSYLPTEEYMEMFPWKDGSKFDWQADSTKIFMSKNKLTGKPTPGRLFFSYNLNATGYPATPSRDPRLYENAIVNGMTSGLDWTTGIASGDEFELWVGGYHAGNTTVTDQMVSCYSTGYGVMKYHLADQVGSDYLRLPLQWVTLGLSEMYLMYAECLAQTGNLSAANNQVQVVRNRVGLSLSL